MWMFLRIILYRDGVIQNVIGISLIPIIVLIQLKDILIDVAGSNVENRFVIIFSLFWVFSF